VTGTNLSTSCYNAASAFVTVIPNPSLSISGNGDLCLGETMTLVASGANSYVWSDGTNGSVLVLAPTISSTYSLSGTSALGSCSSTMSFAVNVSECTGIDENSNSENTLLIYPNPSAGKFFVEVRKPCQISIYDELGRTIFYEDFKSGIQVIDLSNYSNGLYLIKAFNYKSTSFSKVLKND
jgi:hypothetical protein